MRRSSSSSSPFSCPAGACAEVLSSTKMRLRTPLARGLPPSRSAKAQELPQDHSSTTLPTASVSFPPSTGEGSSRASDRRRRRKVIAASRDNTAAAFVSGCLLALLVTCVNDSSCTHTKIRHLQHRQDPHHSSPLAQRLHQPSGGGTSALAPEGWTKKIRHTRGKYTVREEVVRRVEISHPCRLTRTAVKVTFPGMKKEVLVSFIGYKEPNLMFVNRCKGLCSSEAIGHVACVPTKRSWKKVNMQIKSQVVGHQDVREKSKELVLEEHEECACQCLTVSPAHCLTPDLFNNETCSCSCDQSVYHRDRLQCEAYPGRVWDHRTCSCAREDEIMIPPSVGGSSGTHVANAGGGGDPGTHHIYPDIDHHEYVEPNVGAGGGSSSAGGILPGLYDPPVPHHGCTECLNCLTLVGGVEGLRGPDDYVTRNSWTIVGLCTALIAVLFLTTVFYWRKSRNLLDELEGSSGSEEDGSSLRGGSASPKISGKGLTVAISEEDRGKGKKSSISELEARELLLNNSKGANGENSVVVNSHPRMTNSLGRSSNHRDSSGAKSKERQTASNRSTLDKKSSSEKPTAQLATALAQLAVPSASSGKRAGSSASAAARKRQRKQKRKKEEQQYIDPDLLNAPDMIQSCFFEDDLDPNFVNHQKIGAAGGIA